MSAFRFIVAFPLFSLLWACGRPASTPASEVSKLPLSAGGWISITGVADLAGLRELPAVNPALWIPQPAVAGEGWGRLQKGWHLEGDRATLTYWNPYGEGQALRLELLHRGDAPVAAHEVEVHLNGRAVGGFHTQPGPVTGQTFLPPGLLRQVNEVELRIDPPVAESHSERPSHLALVGVQVLGPQQPKQPTRGRPYEELESNGRLQIGDRGVYVLPWAVPDDARQLHFEARGLGRGRTGYELFAVRSSGDRIELLQGEMAGSETVRRAVEIGSLAGERIVVGLQVTPEGPRQGLEIENLNVTSEQDQDRDEESSPDASGDRLPDVLLIILDAARGDRFPGWDYPRPVMPNIAELSRKSLVFRHAFSECPTTSCSVPAMITGRSFLAGGEVYEGPQLSDEVTTLAEYLEDLGYRTVGLSATPNNSATRNLDQGFQAFRELWGRGNPDWGPFSMSRLAVETIEAQPEDQPLFLQLHYLVPHQPYDPGVRFDHFTDPGYEGPVNPWISFLPYNNGLQTLTERDLEHLIGLYDGNLLLADSVVQKVFSALRATGRFENSLLVITSDHGEAFQEHGMLGHNTTLFDEMLHVPLIIRLPGGEIPSTHDPDRLASTLDIVPTILGALGRAPREELGGIDLIHSPADQGDTRMLFLRTSHLRDGMVAVRTRNWKMIAWPRLQSQMLFHLAEDAEERVNLVGEQPYLYAGFGLAARRHMAEALARQQEASEIQLTPEAREELQALGYIE